MRTCTQTLKVLFDTPVFLGSEYRVIFPMNADAISRIRVVLHFPTGVTNPTGERLVREAEIIETEEILYGEFMYLEKLFEMSIEKSNAYTSLVTGSDAYIDLPFYSVKKTTFDQLTLRILFERGSGAVDPRDAYLLVDYVATDEKPEYPYFQRTRQIQRLSAIYENCLRGTMDTYLVGPVYQLFVTIRDTATNQYVDALRNLTLLLDDRERFNLPGYYLRYVEPLKRYKCASMSIPLYLYSFCLDPMNYEAPTGETNFPENQRFIFDLFTNASTYEITIWAQSHNFVYTKDATSPPKPVFQSREMVLDTRVVTESPAYDPVPILASYINVGNVFSITYTNQVTEISGVTWSSNIIGDPIVNSQNELAYSVDSYSSVYYANVYFTAQGYSTASCFFLPKSPKTFVQNEISEPNGIGFLDSYIIGTPKSVIDGGQRLNVLSTNGGTLNGVALASGPGASAFYIDQYRNFYVVYPSSNVTVYDSTLTNLLYTIPGTCTGRIGNGLIPMGNTLVTVTSTYTNPSSTLVYHATTTSGFASGRIGSNVIVTTSNLFTVTNCNASSVTDIVATSNGFVLTFLCGSSSGVIRDSTGNSVATTPGSSQWRQARFLTSSAGALSSTAVLFMFLSSATSGPGSTLIRTETDVFDNTYLCTSADITVTDKNGVLVWQKTFVGTVADWLFDRVTATQAFVFRNASLVSPASAGFSTGNFLVTIPIALSQAIALDINGNVLFDSTPASENSANFVTTFKNRYDLPQYDALTYFADTISYTLPRSLYTYWANTVYGRGTATACTANHVFYSGKANIVSNVYGPGGADTSLRIVSTGGSAAGFCVKSNSTTGVPSWVVCIDGPSTESSAGVAVDSSAGEVFVPGVYSASTGTTNVYNADGTTFGTGIVTTTATVGSFLVKYSESTGQAQWYTYVKNTGEGQSGTGTGAQNVTGYTSVNVGAHVFLMAPVAPERSGTVVYDGSTTTPTVSSTQFPSGIRAQGIVRYNRSDGVATRRAAIETSWTSLNGQVIRSGLTTLMRCAEAAPNTIHNGDGTTNTTMLPYSGGRGDYPSNAIIVRWSSPGLVAQWGAKIRIVAMFGMCENSDATSVYVEGARELYPADTYPQIRDGTGTVTSLGFIPGNNAMLVKLNGTTGAYVWTAYLDQGSGFASCACDSSGNIYVVGDKGAGLPASNIINADTTISVPAIPAARTSAGERMGILIKFNSSGIAQWRAYFDGIGIDIALTVSVDSSDNAVVSGFYPGQNVWFYDKLDGAHNSFQPGSAGSEVAFCVKYDLNGFLVKV